MKKKLSMTSKIMISMLVGTLLGVVFGEKIQFVKVFGDIFLRFIQMSIVLLVLGQVIEAVGMVNPKKLGKLGFKTIVVFMISSLLAALWGVLFAVIFNPGMGLNGKISISNELTATKLDSISKIILDFIPTNIMQALSSGSIIQVIVFAILFGLALSYVNQEIFNDGEDNVILIWVIQFNKIIIKMVMLIMNLAPIGIAALIASTIGTLGVSVIIPLLKYLAVYAVATFTFILVWILFISIYCKLNIIILVKKMFRMSMVAIATTSSAITLPTALKDSEERLGIREKVSKLVVSLGLSLNSNGAAMHMAITVVTVAQIYGIKYGLNEYGYIAILATLSSLANAVVPGAGLVSLTIVIPQMGLPVESIALFAGVEWFVGMLRTILNVDSDVFSAFVVAKSENEIDYIVFNTDN